MEDFENTALNNLSFTPILYKRYVDDILDIVPFDKIDESLNTFHDINDSIKLTIVKEINNLMNYLNLLIIKISVADLITNWYKSHLGQDAISFIIFINYFIKKLI